MAAGDVDVHVLGGNQHGDNDDKGIQGDANDREELVIKLAVSFLAVPPFPKVEKQINDSNGHVSQRSGDHQDQSFGEIPFGERRPIKNVEADVQEGNQDHHFHGPVKQLEQKSSFHWRWDVSFLSQTPEARSISFEI